MAASDKSVERRITDAVLGELAGRKGFDWWWDDLDADIQAEICTALEGVIEYEMREP